MEAADAVLYYEVRVADEVGALASISRRAGLIGIYADVSVQMVAWP